MSAAEEAINNSQIEFKEKRIKYRTVSRFIYLFQGVYVGSSLPSISCITESLTRVFKNDYTHINRMLMLRLLTNLLASNISIKYDLKGPLISPTMACATSLNAIGESYKLIKNNEADVMICGGSENSVHPLVFHSMNKLSTLFNTSHNYTPDKCSRPFDKNRAGFVIGEGSGILVLENLENALKRNAKIYCEVVGYGTFGDAYHLTKPTLDGEGGFRAMGKCILDAGCTPYEINFVNTHSTSTEVGDISELNALKNLFGNKNFRSREYFEKTFENYDFDFNIQNIDAEKLKSLIINANKSQIGHLLGAAGSVESIFGIICMKENLVLDNINTDFPISDIFSFKYSKELKSKHASDKTFNYLMKNSFAFGGVNTSVLYKKYYP
jgi:3-oxoacyl-[acyl-carrier-protein] synthase II